MLPSDTPVAVEQVQIDLLRCASPLRRLEMSFALTRMTIGLSRNGLARIHPELGERELDVLFVEYHYGPALAERVRQCLRLRGAI